MMTALTQQSCEVCRKGAPQISDEELHYLLLEVPDWTVETRDGVRQLERVFSFKDFRQALEFTGRVGELAETQGHHPRITTEWGQVVVTWWTHKIGGLHHNDFIMAAKTDRL